MSTCNFRRRWHPGLLAALLAFLFSTHVVADERILSFHADIMVLHDGSMTVTETIRVRVEGEMIHRGIYRDFPTRYRDRLGNRYNVEFQLLGVTRDGQTEPHQTVERDNGVRVYMGSEDFHVPHGVREYRLSYRTDRQLGFFDDYDELYWNVTGNGWGFAIDRASARIELPSEVSWEELRTDYFTGPQGSTQRNADVSITGSRTVEFRSTAVLAPEHGLTVALGWPKGIVTEPGAIDRAQYFLSGNRAAVILLFGLLAPLGWYLWAWFGFGRDPERGTIIPRFAPPQGLSPAACRYILDMSLQEEAFAAAIVSLGVKGFLTIQEQDGKFTLFRKKTSRSATLPEGEAALLMELLPEDTSWIELDNENHSEFQHAMLALEEPLNAEHHGRLFRLNTIYMLPAVLLTLLAAVIAMPQPGGPGVWIPYAVLSLGMHVAFLFLMRAPTPAGRRVMDEIEGFRMYLDTAEQARLERMKSPELTPEVFETFLPYAFALGVENNWCERFAREFPRDAVEDAANRQGWYHGSRGGLDGLKHIGASLGGSLTSAIASASTPPGSSSGTGGGGFSGGGGGGGGGGGW